MRTQLFVNMAAGVAASGLAVMALVGAGPALSQATASAKYAALQPVMQRYAQPPGPRQAADVETRITSEHEAQWRKLATGGAAVADPGVLDAILRACRVRREGRRTRFSTSAANAIENLKVHGGPRARTRSAEDQAHKIMSRISRSTDVRVPLRLNLVVAE